MPAEQRSLHVTDTYRAQLVRLRTVAERAVAQEFRAKVTEADFDASVAAFASTAAPALAAAQAAGVRLSAAYLTAYLRSELGRPVAAVPLDEARYVGVARSGKGLLETLLPVAITMKKAVGAGHTPQAAVDRGLNRAVRLAASESLGAARGALTQGIQEDERIIGWDRVTAGGCGACLAASTRTYGADEPLLVHDGCRCGAEPVVGDVPQRYTRPDGHALLAAMSSEQQDNLLGPDTAELIRTGQVALGDLIEVNPMVAIPDQITQAPLSALT